MFSKILVPLDGSTFAEKALDPAIEVAQKFNATINLVWVLHPLIVMADYGATTYRGLINLERTKAKEYLTKVQAKFLSNGITIKTTIIDGQPAEQIVDLACRTKADLIVMTTHGRSGLSRWVYGSTATKVLQDAPCPVLLIRAKESDC